ncbi:MAG: serine hydrolase [Pyrinomonadaceae bacterium]
MITPRLTLRSLSIILIAIYFLALPPAVAPVAESQKLPQGVVSQHASTLDERIGAELATFKGKVSLFAENLQTGKSYGVGADTKVPTASTIKIAVMIETYAQVAEGRAKWTDEILLTDAKKVSGSGILQEMSDGLKLRLQDALNLMMVVSDNTATNLILDVLSTDAVNARMEALGLKDTRILRKINGGGTSKAGQDPALKPFGLGVATPREMVTLMRKLHRNEIVSPSASREMLSVMKRERGHDGIGRTLNGAQLATKSGALDKLRSNVGIIYSSGGPIAMAITCENLPSADWTDDNPAYLLMSRLSLILIDELSK